MSLTERHDIAYVILAVLVIGLAMVMLHFRRARRVERRNNRAPIDLGARRDED
ncbi:hypothetical protein [Sphingosinicella sp. BN140058]|uniref:hypothetical protein n=1 Tax=Sphingosinicella sp. BN140058 TaxID=1892855 RepID=UPI0013EBCA30|nr:hypothetical protein [Sphingosinicella sp. BN140058]